MICFILAGGYAKRMWPLTYNIPKCLLPINKKPLLMDILNKIPDMPVYISTNKKFASPIQNEIKNYKDVVLVIEETTNNTDKLGSVGAIINFIDKYNISDDMLIMASDNYFEQDIYPMIDTFTDNPIIGIYDIKDIEKARNYGVVSIEDEKYIDNFIEKSENPISSLIGVGVYIIPKEHLEKIKKIPIHNRDHLGIIIETLIKDSKIEYFKFNGLWADIGSIEEYYNLYIRKANGHSNIINSEVSNCQLENSLLINNGPIEKCRIKNSIIIGSELYDKEINNKIIYNNEEIKLG